MQSTKLICMNTMVALGSISGSFRFSQRSCIVPILDTSRSTSFRIGFSSQSKISSYQVSIRNLSQAPATGSSSAGSFTIDLLHQGCQIASQSSSYIPMDVDRAEILVSVSEEMEIDGFAVRWQGSLSDQFILRTRNSNCTL